MPNDEKSSSRKWKYTSRNLHKWDHWQLCGCGLSFKPILLPELLNLLQHIDTFLWKIVYDIGPMTQIIISFPNLSRTKLHTDTRLLILYAAGRLLTIYCFSRPSTLFFSRLYLLNNRWKIYLSFFLGTLLLHRDSVFCRFRAGSIWWPSWIWFPDDNFL
jgi:hypothetical protein